MTPTPVWLLDVDGVLNALRPDPTRHVVTEACAEGRWFPIAYDPAVITALRELHESGEVELRWLTTWCDDANRSLASAIGMPQLMVEGSSRYRSEGREHGRWWKEPAAHEVARFDPNRLVIWSDDELGVRANAGQVPWLGVMHNVIPVVPDSHEGLTMSMVNAVKAALGVGKEVSA